MNIAAPPPHGVLAVVGDSVPAFPANLLGTSVRGRYRLDRIEYELADSVVFEAKSLRTGGTVSLRLAAPDPHDEGSRTVERKGELLASLDHERVPRLLDRGMTEDGLAYLATEYVEGRPLTQSADAAAAVRIIAQALDALHYLHTKQLVHGNLSPDSFVVTGSSDRSQLKLVDLPDATTVGRDNSVAVSDLTAGAPGYMSPEQIVGDVADARTDLYALGVIFYELLTGQPAWGSNDPEEVVEIQLTRSLPSLPPEAAAYDPFLQRLSARDATDRYSSAVVALDALEAAFLGRGPRRISEEIEARTEHLSAAKDEGPTEYPSQPRRPRSRLPWVVGLLGATAAGLFAWWLASGADGRVGPGAEPEPLLSAASIVPPSQEASNPLGDAGAPPAAVEPPAATPMPVAESPSDAGKPDTAEETPVPASSKPVETADPRKPRRRRTQREPSAAPALPPQEPVVIPPEPEAELEDAATPEAETSPPPQPDVGQGTKLLDAPPSDPSEAGGLLAPKTERTRPSADVLLSR